GCAPGRGGQLLARLPAISRRQGDGYGARGVSRSRSEGRPARGGALHRDRRDLSLCLARLHGGRARAACRRFRAGLSAGVDRGGGARLVVVAVPSHFLRGVLTSMAPFVPPGAILLSATKGLEPTSALRMSEVLSQIAPGRTVAVLSGPSFAREVVLGRPTALVVA